MPHRADHVSDVNGVELARLAQLYEFPDFVKKADMDQVFRPGSIAVTTYADPDNKDYACHNAAATWLSGLYFTEKQSEYHPRDRERIRRNVEHYVDFWGIRVAYDRMVEKAAAYVKEAEAALPDEDFAFVWRDDSTGHKSRRLRMCNAQEVKAAAEYVETHRDRFAYADRNRMATKILKKASHFGAELGGRREFLERQAGRGVGDPDKIYDMIRGRAKLASMPAFKEQIVKLAQTVKDQPRRAMTPDTLVKLAETVDSIDRSLNLVGKYTSTILPPEDVIFEATFTKAASEMAEVAAMTSGKVYKKADLAKVSVDAVRSLFGDDFVGEVSNGLDVDPEKLAEVAATLPRGEAELFDRMMADCGLAPCVEKAASCRQGFTDEDFLRMADSYVGRR